MESTDEPLPNAPFSPPHLDCQVPTPTPDLIIVTTSSLPLPDNISTLGLTTQSSGVELVTGEGGSPLVTAAFSDEADISSIVEVEVDTVHALYTVPFASARTQLASTFTGETYADLEATPISLIVSSQALEDVTFVLTSTNTIGILPSDGPVALDPPTTLDVEPTTDIDIQTGYHIFASWSSQSDRGDQGGSLPSIDPTGSYMGPEDSSNLFLEGSAPNLLGSNEYDGVTTTAVASATDDTYVIYKSGNSMSSQFECEVNAPVTPVAKVVSFLTTFECRFISAHTRGHVSNDTEFMNSVVDFLTIDKTKISSYRRKYESAYDGRTSARNVGILGITVLATVFGGLLLLDLTSFKRDIQIMITNIKS